MEHLFHAEDWMMLLTLLSTGTLLKMKAQVWVRGLLERARTRRDHERKSGSAG